MAELGAQHSGREEENTPNKHKASRNPGKIVEQIITDIVRLLVLVAVVGIVVFGWMFYKSNSNQLPGNIKKSAGFALYYPSKLPQGYSLDKSSAKIENGIVFFSLASGAKKIQVSEQAKPAHPPDLIALTKPQKAQLPAGLSGITPPTIAPSFKEIDCPVGQAVQGANASGSPTAIVLTDTTLLNLSSTSTLATSSLSELVQNLKTINN